MNQHITAIDLFSGAGGFSLAANNLQIEILAAVESDAYAAKTYRQNIVERLGQNTLVIDSDISTVNIDSLMKQVSLEVGELDLLLGGPPCQGFSTHRINNAGENDPRNKLLLRYFDFVKKLKPRMFLVENVPGLLWKRHAEYLSKFCNLADQHNYEIVGGRPFIINARDFGVPQNRKRAFILGVRRDTNAKELTWPPKPTHFSHVNDGYVWRTASTVFEKPKPDVLTEFASRLLAKDKKLNHLEAKQFYRSLEWGEPLRADDPLNLHMSHSQNMKDVIASTPLLGSRHESNRVLDCHKTHNGHKDVYGRVFPHLPSNTITTGCNNPSKGRFVHPWENHGITLRHAARLQSFPDEFTFEGGVIAVAKQIGNAVPYELGFALIGYIKQHLLAFCSRKTAFKNKVDPAKKEFEVA